MSRPNKRPLESIENTYAETHDKPTSESGVKGDSNVNGLNFTLANINNKNSNIPLPPSIKSNNPNINLQHINKLIGLNQQFSNKHHNAAAGGGAGGGQHNVKGNGSIVISQINSQIDRNKQLDTSLLHALEKSDNLEIDINELKKQNKKLSHQMSDLSSIIKSNKRKFDYLEDSIMKNVLNKEKLMNIKLQEFTNKLNAEFDEIKFQLQDELAVARAFKDEDILQTISNLTKTRHNLQHELENVINNNQDRVKAESKELESQLAVYLQSKLDQSDASSQLFEQKQNELNQINQNIDLLNKEIDAYKQKNYSLQESIEDINSSGNHFSTLKVELSNKITSFQQNLLAVDQEKDNYTKKHEEIDHIYQEIKAKVQKQRKTKQVLENSIMEYENTFRFYTIIPNHLVTSQDSFSLNGIPFNFNKCFSHDISNEELISEYSCFTNSSLLGSDRSIIFSGKISNKLVIDTIISTFKDLSTSSQLKPGWEFNFSIKAIEIEGNDVYDIFDSLRLIHCKPFNTPNSLGSQTMIIDDAENFESIMQTINVTENRSKCYIMKIIASNESKNIESNLLFVDFSKCPMNEQGKLIKSTEISSSTIMSSIYNYCKSTKCLFVSKVDDDKESQELLSSLKFVKSI